jgi:hypothetical protein
VQSFAAESGFSDFLVDCRNQGGSFGRVFEDVFVVVIRKLNLTVYLAGHNSRHGVLVPQLAELASNHAADCLFELQLAFGRGGPLLLVFNLSGQLCLLLPHLLLRFLQVLSRDPLFVMFVHLHGLDIGRTLFAPLLKLKLHLSQPPFNLSSPFSLGRLLSLDYQNSLVFFKVKRLWERLLRLCSRALLLGLNGLSELLGAVFLQTSASLEAVAFRLDEF